MSSSKSTASSATNYTDNRRVLGEGSISAEGSNVSVTNTNTNYSLDAEVINRAFGSMDANNKNAWNFGSDALGLGGKAIDANSKNTAAAFSFGSDALGFGEKAIDAVTKNNNAAWDFAGNTVGQAFDSNNKTIKSAFDFGTDAMGAVTGTAAGAIKAMGNTVADAFGFGKESLDFGRAAMNHVANANADALSFADSQGKYAMRGAFDSANNVIASNNAVVNKSLQYGANATADALAAGQGTLAAALKFGANNTDRALDNLQTTQSLVKDAYADAKGRGALTDKILMGAIAAMAVVAFMAVKK